MSNSLTLRITDAGRAAMVNAENTGTDPLTITHIAIGSGLYETTDNQTELQTEIKRLTTFGGQAVAADTVHVTVLDESTDAYSLGEFGLITDAGVLFAVYSGEVAPILEKAASGMMVLSVDAVITSVNVQNLSFSGTGFMLPPGTETVPGILRLADNTEALQGTDDQKAMTAKKTKAVIDQHKAEQDAHTWGQIAEKPVVVSQAHAEAGTVTTVRLWSPQRVRQAITGWWSNSAAKTKLDSIAANATANATDAQLRARSSHTGTQAISTVSGLQSALDGKLNSNHSSVTDAREWTASTVSQSEAEAGSSSTRRAWTAQRVRQAIVAWWNGVTSSWGRSLVASSDAQAGRDRLGLGSMATRGTGTGGSQHRTNSQNESKFVTVDTAQTITQGKAFRRPGGSLTGSTLVSFGAVEGGYQYGLMLTDVAELPSNWPDFTVSGAGGEHIIRLRRGGTPATSNVRGFAIGATDTTPDFSVADAFGVVCGNPTGGFKGIGTLNAETIYVNNNPVWHSGTLQFSLSGSTLTITDNS